MYSSPYNEEGNEEWRRIFRSLTRYLERRFGVSKSVSERVIPLVSVYCTKPKPYVSDAIFKQRRIYLMRLKIL